MLILIGLLILLAAVMIGLAGVLTNGGGTHLLTDHFSVFGFQVNGSTGLLFLCGIVVGAAALFGLNLMVGGVRRTARRGRVARRELTNSRRETAAVSRDRDELAEKLQPATTGGHLHRRKDRP